MDTEYDSIPLQNVPLFAQQTKRACHPPATPNSNSIAYVME